MKKNKIIFVCFLLLLFGFIQINKKENIPPLIYWIHDFNYDTNDSFQSKHGYDIQFYENGQIKSVIMYENNRVNGWAQFWYPNGQLSHAGYLDSVTFNNIYSEPGKVPVYDLKATLYSENLISGYIIDSVLAPDEDDGSVFYDPYIKGTFETEFWPFKWSETGEVINNVYVSNEGLLKVE